MQLHISNRLQRIAEQITPGAYFADIGSDHAYLPCYVCLKDREARAIAGEVAEGPWQRALETVQKFQLEERISVRLGDGLAVIHDEEKVSEIVIAGMGGGLISSILVSGKEKVKQAKKIIAQPNTNAKKVRETFIALDFILIDEIIIEENKQFYEILVAENQQYTTHTSPYDPEQFAKQLYFGPFLLKNKPETFKRKWQAEYDHLAHIVQQMEASKSTKALANIQQLKQRMAWIEEEIR